jgi:hypothetical protein
LCVCVCCHRNQLSCTACRPLHSSGWLLLVNCAVIMSHFFLLKAARVEYPTHVTWEGASSATVVSHLFFAAWQKSWLLALWPPALGSATGSRLVPSYLPDVAAVLCFSLACRLHLPSLLEHQSFRGSG